MADAVDVLYVDDDREFSVQVVENLQRERDPFRIDTATAATGALDRLDTTTYDCLVSAYDLGESTGLDVLESVRESHSSLPVVLFASEGDERVASEAISAGVTDYVRQNGSAQQFEKLADSIERAVESVSDTADGPAGTMPTNFVQSFPDLAFFIDENGTYLDIVVGENAPLLAAEAEQLRGKELRDVFPADRADEVLAIVRQALETGEVQTVEYPLQVQAGYRWFEGRIAPMETAMSDDRTVLWVARDITEYKEREQTLAALHDAAHEIETASDAEMVYDVLVETARQTLEFDVTVVDVERDGALVKMACVPELEEDQYYQRTPLDTDDMFAVRSYNQQETILVDDLRETDIAPVDSKFRSALTVPIGEFGIFQAVSTEVGAYDEYDREFAELIVDHARLKLVHLQDRAQLEAQTRELERQNERLDQFASVVSHDLRNPINTLKLSLEMANESGGTEHFERCQRAVDRMTRLTDDLLELARQGQDIDETEPVVLETVAMEAWETVETGSARLSVSADVTVSADRERIRTLFENLFHNSVEHGSTSSQTQSDDSPDGGSLTVTVGTSPDGFYVEDDGSGIPEDERETVFEMGYSTADSGTGFGLAIVQGIVEAHGWEIAVTDGEAGGVRFEMAGVEWME